MSRGKEDKKKKRTVNRLINPINRPLPIRNPTQTSTGQKPQRTRNNTSLVTNNIPKQVTRDDNPIQLLRILNHDHRRRVDQLMPDLQLRELLRHHLRHRLPPQPAGREHVGLVKTPHGERRVVLQSQVAREAGDALDLGPRVGFRVECVAGAVVFFALAKVDPAGEFADDVEVDAAAYVGAERGDVDERGGGEVAGAEVAEGGHFFAESEEALFGADGARSPFLFRVGWWL